MSDGTIKPNDLIKIAAGKGLKGLALTDHDTMSGCPEAYGCAIENDIEFLHGIEIGTEDHYGNLHILGYFNSPESIAFEKEMDWIKKARVERNDRILEKLDEHDIHLTMDMVRSEAEGNVVGRLHIGKALFNNGLVTSLNEAFNKYLNAGGLCYVPRKTFTSEIAMDLIKDYNGKVSMAHPFLIPDQKKSLTEIIRGLIEQGLDAIEVYYIENSLEQTKFLETVARKNNLLMTGGTDYHGENKPGVTLGTGRGNMNIPYRLMKDFCNSF